MSDLLYCERCRSVLFEVIPEKLKAPLKGNIFRGRNGMLTNWKPEYVQEQMRCPVCGEHPFQKIDEITVLRSDTGKVEHIKVPTEPEPELHPNTKKCDRCGKVVDKRGYSTHRRYCSV